MPEHRGWTYWTPESEERFFEVLSETGYVNKSAKEAGLPRQRVYDWYKTDKAFADRWDEALENYIQKLEAEADRRAAEGVEKPIFWRGQQVGAIRDYSDTLLMFRLNGLRPARYRQRHEHTGKDGEALSLTINVKMTLTEALTRVYDAQSQRLIADRSTNGTGPDPTRG